MTTLSGRGYARWVRELKSRGYRVDLVYLWPLSNSWKFFDSSAAKPELVAYGDNTEWEVVVRAEPWQRLRERWGA